MGGRGTLVMRRGRCGEWLEDDGRCEGGWNFDKRMMVGWMVDIFLCEWIKNFLCVHDFERKKVDFCVYYI